MVSPHRGSARFRGQVATTVLRLACAFVCLFSLAARISAQSAGASQPATPEAAPVFDATQLRQPEPLNMTWLVKAGDDPAFTEPGFDDTSWTRFDPWSSITSLYGKSKPHPVVWYRLHIKVDPANRDLALSEIQIARAFEIYVNGRRVMSVGSVSPYRPYTQTARVLATIPNEAIATGSLVIAVRAHFAPREWTDVQNPGYYANNLTLGQFDTLRREDWLSIIGDNALDWFERGLLIAVGLIALLLLRTQRGHPEYTWIAAVGALALLESPEPIITAFTNIPAYWEIAGDVPRLVSPFVWASLYFAFVNQRIGWRWRIFLAIAGVLNALAAIQSVLFLLPMYVHLFATVPLVFLLAIAIPVALAVHWRRGNREAGILLIPVVLLSLYIYAEVVLNTMFEFPGMRAAAIRGMQMIGHYYVGPFAISGNTLSNIGSSISLAIIMLLRFSKTSRQQALLEAEFEAARQVQEVLVPEQVGNLPGFVVDSVYEPARQVGGDFFQIMAARDGGLLAVIGDVAGKGLPAAMLVSVIVGAVRGIAGYTQDPAEILANLNERLQGRAAGGFSTALAAHISADGAVTLANAGHLPPYLDGGEIVTPGALPLGIVAGVIYETMRFHLAEGSRLTFYSDGVVEAQNRHGELFGFERSREISTRPAAEIVEAARTFGQNDDITVVTIARVATGRRSVAQAALATAP